MKIAENKKKKGKQIQIVSRIKIRLLVQFFIFLGVQIKFFFIIQDLYFHHIYYELCKIK